MVAYDNSNLQVADARKAVWQYHIGMVTHTYWAVAGAPEYVRVPFADVGVVKVPKDVPDENAVVHFAIPTGYMWVLSSAIFNQGYCGCLGLRCCWTICNDQRLYDGWVPSALLTTAFPNARDGKKNKPKRNINYEEVDAGETLKEMTGWTRS